MISTFKSKEDFLAAVSSKLDATKTASAVGPALVAGISSADDTLPSAALERESLALNLKLGSWVIRDDDLPLFQAISTTGTAIALTLTTGGRGMAWPAIAAALSGYAELCWRAWRKGARLSSVQVATYGFLHAHGPMKVKELFSYMSKEQNWATSLDVVKAVLESLREIDTNDGHVIALASEDNNEVWKVLRV